MFDNFESRHAKLKKQIEREQVFAKIWFAFCALIGLGSLGFVVWVIVRTLEFYGIV